MLIFRLSKSLCVVSDNELCRVWPPMNFFDGPMAAVYQRQLSVPSLHGLLMTTSESWGVNGHTTRCTSPVSVVL